MNEEIDKIINNSIHLFLDRISFLSNGPFSDYRKVTSSFEIFHEARLLNNQIYYEEKIEGLIREVLVNYTLFNLFNFYHLNSLWPKDKNLFDQTEDYEIMNKLSLWDNEHKENFVNLEFILVNNKRIGYRYIDLDEREKTIIKNEYHLDELKVISWEKVIKNEDALSFELFFKELFPNIEYASVIERFKKAISDAYLNIGYVTVPRLTNRYLSDFRQMLEYKLKDIDYRNYLHSIFTKYDLNSLNNEDYEICYQKFIKEGKYKALFGLSKYAKCFITSEYQYQLFIENDSFDYTSIACGYLKFIEQLLHQFMLVKLNSDLWIRCFKIDRNVVDEKDIIYEKHHYKIRLKEKYYNYFDLTLGSLIDFVCENSKEWYLQEESINTTKKLLDVFRKDCRNDHFHKDNIDDYSVIERIRDNTIILAFLLLGGYKIALKDLYLIDDSFDILYKEIQKLPRGITKFIIKDKDKERKAYRLFSQDNPEYQDGLLNNTQICFIEVDEFRKQEYQKLMQEKDKKIIIIDREHIPIKISYINGRGEIISIR